MRLDGLARRSAFGWCFQQAVGNIELVFRGKAAFNGDDALHIDQALADGQGFFLVETFPSGGEFDGLGGIRQHVLHAPTGKPAHAKRIFP